MGDVLSQDEIDSLLSALNSGEINPDEIDDTPKVAVKDYDFASQNCAILPFVAHGCAP